MRKRLGYLSLLSLVTLLGGCTGRIVDDGTARPLSPNPNPPADPNPTPNPTPTPTPNPTPNPPADPTPTSSPDGGVAPDCSVAGACPCFSNDDCPAQTFCHTETDTKIYCKPGARGTGALGASCGSETDCKSGVCYTPPTGPSVCTATCNGSDCVGSVLPRCTPLNTSPPVKACL